MALTLSERETIIVFNEQDPLAEVFTYNGRMKRELSGLACARPDDVQHTKTNTEGGETYTVPKKWVKIRASRILTEEQKENLRQASANTRFVGNCKHPVCRKQDGIKHRMKLTFHTNRGSYISPNT